jgi:signal transduction histidine kinase
MLGRALRTLVFLGIAVVVGGIGLAVLIAGWTLVAVLAITPLVIPALVAFRIAVGGATRLDGELANGLLGTSVKPPVTSPGPGGFWRAGWNVLTDGVFWRQHTYLMIRLSLGFVLAVAEWALVAASLGLVTLPIWYRWPPDTQVFGIWHVDSLGDAFIWVPVGLVGLALALALTRPLEAISVRLVRDLLSGPRAARAGAAGWPGQAVRVHALAYAALNAVLIAIWALTSHGYFWPMWPLLTFGAPLALHAWVAHVESRPERGWRTRALDHQAGISAILAVFLTVVWAITSRGYFWPVWPILALVLMLGVHAVVAYLQRGSRERIEVLEQTRAGAVDQQETDLERIERDLHDGAQARLVALGMSIGMAEQKLASDPEAAQALLAEARQGTREALEELRSLARGIRPPVLSDRGLEAAIMALADRTPVRVDVHVQLASRPPRAVETAAYYVVAEALANAGKHAEPQRVDITVRDDAGTLVVEVMDDGVGGADASGSGLRGLARRVEALDGTLSVRSPAGGPTIVKAVVPCGS